MKLISIVFLSLILSVQVFAQSTISENLDKEFNTTFYKNQFSGLYVYNPENNEVVYSYNSDKYFIPASNTKIFTLFTSLKILGDSIPAFKYKMIGEELHIQGTGDPTFLNPNFVKNNRSLDFLKNNGKKIILHWANKKESFLPGWVWDDFSKDYSSEVSQFPVYENMVTFTKYGNSIKTVPEFFAQLTSAKDTLYGRNFHENKFYIGKKANNLKIPFIVDEDIIKNILYTTTGKPIDIVYSKMPFDSETYYSNNSKEIYKIMMKKSDNFLAEQLLFLVSSKIFQDNLSTEDVINYAKKNFFKKLKQEPQWYDGSGLSRYNLFTPENFVQILDDLYKNMPENKLFQFFPIIKTNNKGEDPYVFAKTGTMKNILNLSGFIKTKSGKILIFSLLNNNFIHSFSSMRNQNNKILRLIRNNY